MFERVIVPVEETGGEEAIALGRQLARRLDASLTLLHVHHRREAPSELEGLPQYRFQHVVETWDGMDADDEAHEVEWLSRRAAAVAGAAPDLEVSSRVVHAPLSRTLRAEGRRVMVVTSAGDRLDETTHEIIRAGGVPVLLAGPRRMMSLDTAARVFVALDGSRFSAEILEPALDFADALGLGVTLVQVVSHRQGLGRFLHPGEMSAAEAEVALREVRQRVRREAAIEIRVVEGVDAAAALVIEAGREPGGVLALATHGRGGLRRLFMGSVAERVFAESAVPVLLLRPAGVNVPPQPLMVATP